MLRRAFKSAGAMKSKGGSASLRMTQQSSLKKVRPNPAGRARRVVSNLSTRCPGISARPGTASSPIRPNLLGRCDLNENRLGLKLFLSIHTNSLPVQERDLQSCPATHHGPRDLFPTAYICSSVRLLVTVDRVDILPSKRHIFCSRWRCTIDADTRDLVSINPSTR